MLKITKGLNVFIINEITTYTDDEGNEYVRVRAGREDFCIAAHDYDRGGNVYFTWDSAMKSLEYNGLTMLTKEQVELCATHFTEINNKLKKIGGKALKYEYYWASTEYDADHAWGYIGSTGHITYKGLHNSHLDKQGECRVRPVLNL